MSDTTAHPWEVSCGALRLQYKVIKSPGINTVDSKCLTPVDVAHYAFMSCSTLRLINTLTRLQPLTILLTPNPAGDEVTLLNEGFIWQSYPAWMRV